MATTFARARDLIRLPWCARRFRAGLNIKPLDDLVEIADPGCGGYVIPASRLGPDSVVILCGTSTDIFFDLDLIRQFGCRGLAVDPVPAAAEYVAQAAAGEPRHALEAVACAGLSVGGRLRCNVSGLAVAPDLEGGEQQE